MHVPLPVAHARIPLHLPTHPTLALADLEALLGQRVNKDGRKCGLESDPSGLPSRSSHPRPYELGLLKWSNKAYLFRDLASWRLVLRSGILFYQICKWTRIADEHSLRCHCIHHSDFSNDDIPAYDID